MSYSAELGDYIYKLNLNARPAASERVRTSKQHLEYLKSRHSFRNFVGENRQHTVAQSVSLIHLDEDSVTVDPSPDWNGTDGEISIRFEPLSLGEVHDTLVTSENGEYVVMFYGHGIAPLPQGPFIIPDGNS